MYSKMGFQVRIDMEILTQYRGAVWGIAIAR